MRPRRAICVSRDAGVRRIVGEAVAAAGLLVEYVDQLPHEVGEVAAVIVDRATRLEAGDALCRIAAPVVVVGDDLEDAGLLSLMLDAPVSHAVGDPADRALGITSMKLATGDLFGLEKYLAMGATVSSRVVRSDLEKRRAMEEVCAWAEAVGARRPIVHRLGSVIDELLMNALHDTPATTSSQASALLRWGSDERSLAISVGDGFGALRQRDVMANVRRARDEGGRPRPETAAHNGAGLGLYLVLANVASLIVNVAPGSQTEVVCLFDLAGRTERGAVHAGVRSLHMFAGI